MNVLQRHKVALLEQLAGAKVLATALRKRARHIGLSFHHLWDLPTLFQVVSMQNAQNKEAIETVDQAVQKVNANAQELRLRLRHHEHGPLVRSTRAYNEKMARLAKVEAKLAQAKTADERRDAEKEAAQLSDELEAAAMPEADVTIDTRSGQAIDGEPGKPRIIRMHEQ
jgi:hypothetical protein